jgi:hypothetical protein
VATPFLAALALGSTLTFASAGPLPVGQDLAGASFTTSAPFGTATTSLAPEPLAYAAVPGQTLISPLTLAAGSITGFGDSPKEKKQNAKKRKKAKPPVSNEGLGPERARILLRSLTVPGWGQATLGHKGSARVFLLAEAGVWGAFTAFKVQQVHRTGSYLRTAKLSAGIDLEGRDDEFRRIVGAFASSDEYNLLVVTRDAANLYLSDPANQDLEGYRRYVTEHSIGGELAWAWSDEGAFRRYGGQRKFAQKAGLRANAALGFAIANRLVSALHAARQAGHEAAATPPQGWRFELAPGLDEAGQIRAALTTSF